MSPFTIVMQKILFKVKQPYHYIAYIVTQRFFDRLFLYGFHFIFLNNTLANIPMYISDHLKNYNSSLPVPRTEFYLHQTKNGLHQTPPRSKVKVAKVPYLCDFWPLFFYFLVSSTTVFFISSVCGNMSSALSVCENISISCCLCFASTNWNLSTCSVIIKMFFQSFLCRIN